MGFFKVHDSLIIWKGFDKKTFLVSLKGTSFTLVVVTTQVYII